ncbi:hypothetical protein [Entomobacter blattae]|uniref:hypothetical protein n=1 Tax=Entomobacter blattae TaxID=2762277 RepID=UPI00193C7908|nr:hypothetical protein [Entomobacter blattae]
MSPEAPAPITGHSPHGFLKRLVLTGHVRSAFNRVDPAGLYVLQKRRFQRAEAIKVFMGKR